MLYLESRQAHLRGFTISTWLERIDFLFHFVRVCCPDHWSKICIEGTKRDFVKSANHFSSLRNSLKLNGKRTFNHKECVVEISQQYKGHTGVIEGHQNVF